MERLRRRPTWTAWWIQNSYGTTYAALPLYTEPLTTFLMNAHDLWFDQMGDGRTVRPFVRSPGEGYDRVPPDGCLCDAAAPGWFVARQGDGRVDIHDWGMEFTAAGLLMQAEALLIDRDPERIARYLPKLRRCADFIWSRYDPSKNLFLAGPAGNLLAPGYAAWKKPDGTYGQAYLAGLSVTTIAALDRLIEVEKPAGNEEAAARLADRRDRARRGLPALTTPVGYLVRSIDPDGTRHGVYGAAVHGYFETPPNHDAICLRVVDDDQARRIYEKIVSIPGLRPYDLILPNRPSCDDMYEEPEGLWAYGTWVNGGHWSTCEARMIMGYYRVGAWADAARSMRRMLGFAARFRLDNLLTGFGSEVYQPHEPINITYDAFGPPTAMIRGLFEYLYRAESLVLVPHAPPGIHPLRQKFPIRSGRKRLYLSTSGVGPITAVRVNGRPWPSFDAATVTLPWEGTPDRAVIEIRLGTGLPTETRPADLPASEPASDSEVPPPAGELTAQLPPELSAKYSRIHAFLEDTIAANQGERYEAAHARLALQAMAALVQRRTMLTAGRLRPLPEPSASVADRLNLETADRLAEGLAVTVRAGAGSADADRNRIAGIWDADPGPP